MLVRGFLNDAAAAAAADDDEVEEGRFPMRLCMSLELAWWESRLRFPQGLQRHRWRWLSGKKRMVGP